MRSISTTRSSDFLITDEELARALDGGGRELDEKLLIAENDGEAEVSLYLGQSLLERLERSDPLTRLDSDNLEDFWTAFEGVSHFTYYAWNAQLEKPVTLLEMELQAEVDKYVATTLLLSRQGQRHPRGLASLAVRAAALRRAARRRGARPLSARESLCGQVLQEARGPRSRATPRTRR